MIGQVNSIDILIGRCKYMLERAEDMKNLDLFNYWMAELYRLQRERAKLLNIKLGGV